MIEKLLDMAVNFLTSKEGQHVMHAAHYAYDQKRKNSSNTSKKKDSKQGR